MKSISLAARLSKSFSFYAAFLIALCGALLYYTTAILTPQYEMDAVLIALVLGEIIIVSIIMMALTKKLCSKHLEKQLDELQTGAHRLASGDFSGNLQVYGSDELGDFATAMNTTSSYLVNLLKSVYAISGELVKAAEQLDRMVEDNSGKSSSLRSDVSSIGSQLLTCRDSLDEMLRSLHNVSFDMNTLQEKAKAHIQATAVTVQTVDKLEVNLTAAKKYLVGNSRPIADNCEALAKALHSASDLHESMASVHSFINNIKEMLLALALDAAKEGRPEQAEQAHVLNNLSHGVMSGMDRILEEFAGFKETISSSLVLLNDNKKELLSADKEFQDITVLYRDLKVYTRKCREESLELDELIGSGGEICQDLEEQLHSRLAATDKILEGIAGVKASANSNVDIIKTPARQIRRATKKLQNLSLQFKT